MILSNLVVINRVEKFREKKRIIKMNDCNKNKIACIFNYPAHYRQNIFLKMEENLNCNFYFGDIEKGKIKKIDYKLFQHPIKDLETKNIFFNINWINGAIPLLFKSYDQFILIGEPHCLSTWCFLILNKFLNKKIYLWGHGWYGREGKIKTFIKKIFFNLSDGVFLYGNHAKKLMILEGFNPAKLHVIYNSLDYELQLKIRKQLTFTSIFQEYFKNNYPVLIFTGRLTKVKKIDLLIEAHHLLNERGIKLNVLILGNGHEKTLLEKKVKAKGLEKNYWFYGECYDEYKIGEFYYNSLACTSPGNVGLTGIHSMTYGCPVITNNNLSKQMPEFEAIKEYKTGCFFKEDDVIDLSDCILKLLNNSFNREDIRLNCFEVIDKYYNPNYQIKIFKKVLVNKK